MFVLACFTFMDVPQNLKHFCHSRWITTTNGYLRLLIYQCDKLSVTKMTKLINIVSYIVCSFLMIHLKPKTCEGPFITLFQRNLLLAYREIDDQTGDIIFIYFIQHVSFWLSPENVTLNLFSVTPPLSLQTVKITTSLPKNVDIPVLLKVER